MIAFVFLTLGTDAFAASTIKKIQKFS